MTATRLQETLAGDWPSVGFVPPRIQSAPARGHLDKNLEHEVLKLCDVAGLVLDPWEEWYFLESLRQATCEDPRKCQLGPNEHYHWAALECGLCCPRQNGKGNICYTTPVLTTDGWTTHGEVRVGQYVYGSDGKPTRVVARSEVFLADRCYEVAFADGSSHTVGQDHLWTVWDTYRYNVEAYTRTLGSRDDKRRASRGGAWTTLATREIAESRWCHRHPVTGRNGYRYRVRCDAVPQTPFAELPIDPYVLGLWLGDGSNDRPVLTTGNEDLPFFRQALLDGGLEIVSELPGNREYQPWHVRFRCVNYLPFPSRLRQLGVFRNKHIPDAYLAASPAQRLALLQGLMDTDGSIGTTQNKSPQVEFSTSIPALAETFHVLARSLGIRVAPKWRETTRKPNCRFLWTPTFNPFRLPRKANRYRPPSDSYRRADRMAITGVREVPSVPTRCIQVEAEDGVYLVGRTLTPTHNSILEARELVGLFIDKQRWPHLAANLAVHSAHRAKTAHEGFERLVALIDEAPSLRAKLRGRPRRSEGAEVIRTLDGRRLRFCTRTSAEARGLSGDFVAFDEAMIFAETLHGSVWPIITARANPQVFYTGSAVDELEPLMDENGVVFSRVRKRGIDGDPDLLYAEWSLGKTVEDGSVEDYESPEEVTPEVAADPDSWRLANPNLDVRLSRRIIAVEQRSLSARNFARERLGVGDWPDPESQQAIDAEKWKDAALAEDDERRLMLDPVCYAVDVAPGRKRCAISVAGRNAGGKDQVEVVARFSSPIQLIPTLKLLTKRRRRAEIVVDGVGEAASLIPEMEQEHLNVQPVTSGEHARACGMFYDGVEGDEKNGFPPTLNHLDDPALNAAVAGARTRKLGDRWAWDRQDSSVDITTLVSCTLALYGFRRSRRGTPSVLPPGEVLDEGNDEFDTSDLPPLEEEDL